MNTDPVTNEISKTETAKTVRKTTTKGDKKNLYQNPISQIWYFQKMVNGKKEFNGRATPFTLETTNIATARAKRDAILAAADRRAMDRALGVENRNTASIQEVLDTYLTAPTVCAAGATRKLNVGELSRLIRRVKGDGVDLAKVSTAELNRDLVKDWQILRLADATKECTNEAGILNREKFEMKKRSMNGNLIHAKGIFSAEALSDYRKLYLPDNITEFKNALPVPARKQDEPKQIKDEVIGELVSALPFLQKESPGTWAAFLLMMWGGLRNIECFHAKKNWLEEIPAGYRVDIKADEEFLPKGRSRVIILPKSVGDALLAQIPKGTKLLVPGQSWSDRHKCCYRRLNKWLIRSGVRMHANKISYRLRKWFLAKVAEQQGVAFAMSAAGHGDLNTLQNHYVAPKKMDTALKFGAVAAS